MYRKIRKTLGVLLIVSAIILTQIPYPKAKAYQADFKMDGTTLVRYTGTAETVSVPASVEVPGSATAKFLPSSTVPINVIILLEPSLFLIM